MSTATLVPVEEYLRTDYEPDCDYIDGVLEERNIGEQPHSVWQGEIYAYFHLRRKELGVFPRLEWRIRICPTRYRVPDVCLIVQKTGERILTSPPHVIIEILSPEDRLTRFRRRIDDYVKFGVRNVWLIDPEERRAWYCTADGMIEAKDFILRATDPEVVLPLQEIFRAIDEE
jgi:Uma2 family endonuclease